MPANPARARLRSWILLLLAAAACSSDPVSNQPVRQRGVNLGEAPRPKREKRRLEEPLQPITVDDPLPGAEEPKPSEGVVAEKAAPEAEEKPPRDLRNELETMFGSPASCLEPRPAKEAPSQVTISLSANVMPSGAVGRGEVSAPGLSAEELRCVRSRLESLRFAQPIEDAPRNVSGSITLNRGS